MLLPTLCKTVGWWCAASSLSYDLGRVRRVKAKPLRGRFASLDTSVASKDWQLREGRGRTRMMQVMSRFR
jgi:hypothetical protein